MWASAEHEPWQLAWHLPLHSAVPGVPVQLAEHSLEQVALQLPSHSAWFAFAAHLPWQLPSHVAVQLPSHWNFGGSMSHSALQSPSQLPWQDGRVAVHSPSQEAWSSPWQAASKFIGVHSAVQSTPTLASHLAFASTLMLPHASIPALAFGAISGAASTAARANRR
jgi:hypothetical protein